MLGHSGVDFSEAGGDLGHPQISPEERLSGHAEAQSRARLRRARQAHARTKDLSHVSGLLRRNTRDQEA